MRIIAFSDTHGCHRSLTVPDGDVLVFAGDYTRRDSEAELRDFSLWWNALPHQHKLFVAGNHDRIIEQNSKHWLKDLYGITSLEDSEAIIDGVRFYGTPWQPEFNNWSFNLPEEKLERKWDLIPSDTDVLITHVPCFEYFDWCKEGNKVIHIGSSSLLKAFNRVTPRVHIFGHCHEAQGWGYVVQNLNMPASQYPRIYNVAVCDNSNTQNSQPRIIDL